MAYMVSCECINCGACEYECPVRAISPGASQFGIDAATCVECDGYFDVPRCKAVCPVGACSPLRESYLARMTSLSSRGTHPVRIVKSVTGPIAYAVDRAVLVVGNE